VIGEEELADALRVLDRLLGQFFSRAGRESTT
jgi:hypothetical protein